jgi:hypothetical protein
MPAVSLLLQLLYAASEAACVVEEKRGFVPSGRTEQSQQKKQNLVLFLYSLTYRWLEIQLKC